MRTVILIFVLALTGKTVQAQTINLAKDPAKPSLTEQKSNAQLLKESQPGGQPGSDTASLNRKFNTTGVSTNGTTNNSYMNGNPQPMNSQSQQINLGGTKATNNVYYDNSGKVQGSGTTIEFGKKK